MNERIWALRDMIEDSDSIVFFGGIDVSTESGIPDYRSIDARIPKKRNAERPAEEVLHKNTLRRLPTQFFKYYRKNMLFPRARPNKTHFHLVELEQRGKLDAVITQNVDGLHQMAGAKNVIELHGSINENYCVACNERYSLAHVFWSEGIVPRCNNCGNVVRPDIVLYGEEMRRDALKKAQSLVQNCDMLIVGGTSLAAYPAASLLIHYFGDKLVLISKGNTGYDGRADLVIRDSVSKTLSSALKYLRWEKLRA